MDTDEYHYPNEFTLDGTVFGPDTPKKDLIHIRDDLEFLEDDIVVATYPKAGKTCMGVTAKPSYSGLILGLRPANERRRCKVTK